MLQLVLVTVIVVISTAIYAWAGLQRLASEAQSTALAIAQSVAVDHDIRAAVTEEADSPGPPAAAELATGPVARGAEAVRARTGALFVVVTDERGIRLAHPDAEKLGSRVSTSPDSALRGEETVSWEQGTLGLSARAKVPIYALGSTGADDGPVVGEVSVGFAPQWVFADLVTDALPLAGGALAALAVGLVASALIRRRLSRLTLGLGPEELAALVQNQSAVLGGVGEGVIGISPDGVVTVSNPQAARLLDREIPVGRRLDTLGLPDQLAALVSAPGPTAAPAQLVVGAHVLFIDVRTVVQDGVDFGRVLVLRDRTDVEALTRRLDAVAAMTTALRVQRHEFANRLHAISGLLEIGQTGQAKSYLASVLDHGPLKYPVQHSDRLTEPHLQAFIGAKGIEAAERGVLITIGAETLVTGTLCDPEDVTTVLGNLIDNAVTAALAGTTRPAWVEVELLDDDAELHLSVMDSGDGLGGQGFPVPRDTLGSAADPLDGANATSSSGEVDRVRGLGFGLPLSRDIARRRGGELWLASDAVAGAHGAVFCVRLPGTVRPRS